MHVCRAQFEINAPAPGDTVESSPVVMNNFRRSRAIQLMLDEGCALVFPEEASSIAYGGSLNLRAGW